MIKVHVSTGIGEQWFTFDYHSEALKFTEKLGSITNCDITVYRDMVVVDRQCWYNSYVQYVS